MMKRYLIAVAYDDKVLTSGVIYAGGLDEAHLLAEMQRIQAYFEMDEDERRTLVDRTERVLKSLANQLGGEPLYRVVRNEASVDFQAYRNGEWVTLGTMLPFIVLSGYVLELPGEG